jgi:uncharacterized membrane protein
MQPSRLPPARAVSNVNLWKIPLQLSLSGVALFALTMVPDVLDAKGIIHIPVWLTMGGIDDARAILGAMLSCVSTVLALIFSVALLVLSMVATLFGPRLLYRFLQDWVTQFTIGLFMATFVYLCLVFLVTHQDTHTSFIPQVSLITAWMLVVGSFGFLVYYSHRIATSIQNPDLIARIVDDMAPAATRSQTSHFPGKVPAELPLSSHLETKGATVKADRSGYVQELDQAPLVAAASRVDAVITLVYRPGQFVLVGETIALVHPPERLPELDPLVRRHVTLGRHRTLKQDFEFGIAQIVEIGIRALSPAVNDTFTGVACIDWLGDALLVVADVPRFDGLWYDEAGQARVRIRPLLLERLVRMAFDQMRQAASDNPAVLVRILDTVRRIAPRMPREESQRALTQVADAVREVGQKEILATIDRDDVEAAWKRAALALAPRPETSTASA